MVLLTYGCSLAMSTVHETTVKNFINNYALKKAVNMPQDGLYDYALKFPAKIVSDQNDTNLCPQMNVM